MPVTNGFLPETGSLSLFAKSIAAIVGIVVIYAIFSILERTLPRHFGRADARYRVRKFIAFFGYVCVVLFLAILFEDRLGRLSFAIGVVGAGVAVALQDVVASIAGAFSIGFSRLYTVGDRVQIGDNTRGDVIDIGLLRTTLMETGTWVSKDLYNGRVVRVPNSAVLKGTVYNYSQGFPFVWDEIKIVLTTTSDCRYAREMLLRTARESIGEYLIEAQISWRVVSDNYKIQKPPLEPFVTLSVVGGALEFGLSYVVEYTKRTAKQDELFSKIVAEVSNSNGRLQWSSTSISATVNIGSPNTPASQAPGTPASQQIAAANAPASQVPGAPSSQASGPPASQQIAAANAPASQVPGAPSSQASGAPASQQIAAANVAPAQPAATVAANTPPSQQSPAPPSSGTARRSANSD
jgi:small-conductance mechanosensitive channel